MKKALLYLLIFSYSTMLLKPVLPVISDKIAHIFWYSEHMATVHYEHGQYHVHYELYEAAKKGYPEKNNTTKEDDQVNIHLSSVHTYHFNIRLPLQNKFLSFSSALADTYTSSHYPPPKVA
jgi:hypothetical protein